MFKKILITTVVIACSTSAQAAMTDPSIASLKIYGIALSTSADCSNATVVGYNEAGTDYDFKTNPSIFSGAIAAGTYPCVILYMSSVITFTPATSTGNCTAGTSYSRNVCSGGASCQYTTATPNASNILVYGSSLTNSTGTNSQDITHPDKVLLFISTGSTGTGNDAFKQPLAATPTYGLNLASPFVVSEDGSAGTFVVNFNGQVDGAQTPCDLGPPTFSFR